MPKTSFKTPKKPVITRGIIREFRVCEVHETELDMLERGSPSSTSLNFAIFLLSTAISFFVALTTAEVTNDRVFTIYIVIIAVGSILGAIQLIKWYRNRNDFSDTIKKIRKRLEKECDEEEDIKD